MATEALKPQQSADPSLAFQATNTKTSNSSAQPQPSCLQAK